MENFQKFKLIAFDADDTLWLDEPFFKEAVSQLESMLCNYCCQEDFLKVLYQREQHNLAIFGYGAKGFTLSMIETAIEISKGDISGTNIQKIINIGKWLVNNPIQLTPAVEKTIATLSDSYPLAILTKGDLFDQESKVARSGLADFFQEIQIVSEKDRSFYSSFIAQKNINPSEFVMVGNSLRSDIIPVIENGSYGIHIPTDTGWAHEQCPDFEEHHKRYFKLTSISGLPDLISDIEHAL